MINANNMLDEKYFVKKECFHIIKYFTERLEMDYFFLVGDTL